MRALRVRFKPVIATPVGKPRHWTKGQFHDRTQSRILQPRVERVRPKIESCLRSRQAKTDFRGTSVAGSQRDSQFNSRSASNSMAADDEVLTVKEVCHALQVHPSTLYKLVRQGSIPSFRVGSDWRFRRDVIESWMVEQSMYAPRVRKVVETGVHGEARHLRKAAPRGPKR
jgi:excisionase family DNA binding protein